MVPLQNLERAGQTEWRKMSGSVGKLKRSHRQAAEGQRAEQCPQESHIQGETKAIEYTRVVHSVESGRRKENRY